MPGWRENKSSPILTRKRKLCLCKKLPLFAYFHGLARCCQGWTPDPGHLFSKVKAIIPRHSLEATQFWKNINILLETDMCQTSCNLPAILHNTERGKTCHLCAASISTATVQTSVPPVYYGHINLREDIPSSLGTHIGRPRLCTNYIALHAPVPPVRISTFLPQISNSSS